MSGLSEKMNFAQRVQNFVLKLGINMMTLVHFYITDQMIQEYMPGSPSGAEMVANISGCLVNSHSIYEVPMPRNSIQLNFKRNFNRELTRDQFECFIENHIDFSVEFYRMSHSTRNHESSPRLSLLI